MRQIQKAPTRWGRVSISLITKRENKSIIGRVALTGAETPKELHFKPRLPAGMSLERVTVNGENASLAGINADTVRIQTKGKKQFEIVGQIS